MDRRAFLKMLGLATAATAAGLVVPEPERIRRWWAVPRGAPVGHALDIDAIADGEFVVRRGSMLMGQSNIAPDFTTSTDWTPSDTNILDDIREGIRMIEEIDRARDERIRAALMDYVSDPVLRNVIHERSGERYARIFTPHPGYLLKVET